VSKITIDDNFGSNQLLKDIAPQSHMIDIRVRFNGKYYWFEGDFLKSVFPHIQFNQIDNDGIKADLEGHEQIEKRS
jgi:hypothetical protein